jgi:hypothetical protein
MSGLLEIELDIMGDGVSAPGFPLNESFHVDDFFAQKVSQAANGSSFSSLAFVQTPSFDTDGYQRFVFLSPSVACLVRVPGQTSGSISLSAGGFVLWIKTNMEGFPTVNCSATTTFHIVTGRLNP